MKKRPNFLFIMTDQQRWDTVGAEKPENLKTPTLDKITGDGYNFSNAYCQGPICIPSRASFLTGKYVHQHRLFHNNSPLPDYETTWGDVLFENGYQTVAIGRTHTIHKGFDYINVPLGDSWLDTNEIFFEEDVYRYGHEECVVYKGGKENYIEYKRTKAACDCLIDLKARQIPFAMFLGYVAPHNPYILPEELLSCYKDDDFRKPRIFEEDFKQPDYLPGTKQFYDKMQDSNPSRTTKYYYTMVSMIDECIGRVIEQLKHLDLLEDTIIIFTSDHGEMLGDHGRWAKGCIYDEAVKVPLIFYNPKYIPHGASPTMVESVDLFPTILDYAGINMRDKEYRIRGSSLKGIIEGREKEIKDAVFSQLPNWIMVATEDWKLGYGYDENPQITCRHHHKGILFDRKNDPDERYNLYNDDTYKPIVNQLMQRIVDFHLDVQIPLHKDIPEIAFEYAKSYPMVPLQISNG